MMLQPILCLLPMFSPSAMCQPIADFSALLLLPTPALCTWLSQAAPDNPSDDSLVYYRTNYERLIRQLHQTQKTLHLILTCSQAHIKKGQLKKAKQLLKQARPYCDSAAPDPMLLIICLNNLAQLYCMQKHYHKALNTCLSAISFVSTLPSLYTSQNNHLNLDDGVVFVSVFALAKSILDKIILMGIKQPYVDLEKIINKIGFRKAVKYFGQNSFLANKFKKPFIDFKLPFYKKDANQQQIILDKLKNIWKNLNQRTQRNQHFQIQSKNSQNKFNNEFKNQKYEYIQQQIQKQVCKQISIQILPNVEFKIKSKIQSNVQLNIDRTIQNKVQSTIINNKKDVQFQIKSQTQLWTQKKIEAKKQIQKHIQTKPQEIKIKKKTQIQSSVTVVKNDYQITQQLLTIDNEQLFSIACKKANKLIQKKISKKHFQILLSQLNIQDVLPYDRLYQIMSPQEIINNWITPFLHIVNDQIVIYPHSIGIVQPFYWNCCAFQAIVFLNHIQFNQFRLSISPKYLSCSFYLNLELSQDTLKEHFHKLERQDQIMTKMHTMLKHLKQKKIYTYNLQIKDKEHTTKYLLDILCLFEQFINKMEDETNMSQLLEKEYTYIKYTETGKNRGRFYLMSYISALDAIDVYIETSHATATPLGWGKAKGHTIYKKKELMGKVTTKYNLYCEVLSKKYTVMGFEQSLNEQEVEKYSENALVEYLLTQNTFKMQFEHNDYMCPISVGVITINNQLPVAVKYAKYDPVTCSEEGFMIIVHHYLWKKQKNTQHKKKNLLTPISLQFPSKKLYFFDQWMLHFGFKRLIQCKNLQILGDHILGESSLKFILF